MFYCVDCAKERGWIDGGFKSFGQCEICDKQTLCNDVPSRFLVEADAFDICCKEGLVAVDEEIAFRLAEAEVDRIAECALRNEHQKAKQ